MRTILFGNRQNFNIIARLALSAALCVAILFVRPVNSARSHDDWTSPLKECWRFANPDSSSNNLASDNERIFIPTSNGSIIAVNQSSGLIMWTADLGGNIFTQISVSGKKVYTSAFFGSESDESNIAIVREVDPESGLPYWQVSENRQNSKHLSVGPNSPFISYSEDGIIERYGDSGISKWKTDLRTSVTSVSSLDDMVFLGTINKTVLLIRRDTGEIVSQINTKGVPNAVAGYLDYLLVGDSEGNVSAFRGGRYQDLWKTKTGGGISGITIFENDAIVISKDNFVYSISLSSGKKNWKRKLSGRIYGMAQIDQNHAVFAASGSTTAVILDLLDGRLVNKLDLNEEFVSPPVKIEGGFAVATESSVIAVANSACGN